MTTEHRSLLVLFIFGGLACTLFDTGRVVDRRRVLGRWDRGQLARLTVQWALLAGLCGVLGWWS